MSHSLITKKLNGYETNWWKGIVISRALEEQAKKRFQLSDKISGAQRYYIMRMFEKKHLEQEFKDSVFFTFTDGYTQSIYPKMSTLYLYTTSRGKSEVPWFNN